MPSVSDNLQQGSDQTLHQKYQPPTHVPTSFTWSGGWGNHVCIAGSFDPPAPSWSPIEMPKNKDNVNEVILDLLPGKKFCYKFVIDNAWVLHPGKPTIFDESGNENHEIEVELPPIPIPPPSEEEKGEVIVEKEVDDGINEEQQQQQQQEEVVAEDHHEEELKVVDYKEHQQQDEPVITEDQQHEEQVVVEDQEKPAVAEDQQVVVEDQEKPAVAEDQQVVVEDHEKPAVAEDQQVVVEDQEKPGVAEDQQVVVEDQEKPAVAEDQQVVVEDQQYEKPVVTEDQQHEEQIVAEDQHQEHREEQVTDYDKIHHHQEEQVEHQHQEEQVIADEHQHQEEQVVANDHQHQEEQVITNEHHQEEQVIADEHHHQEEQVTADEHPHQEEQVITNDHHHQEEQVIAGELQHQEEKVITNDHHHQEKQVMADEHQHQEEQVITNEHQHQEEQVIADEHQHQERQVIADEHQHQEEQVITKDHQHQEEQVITNDHHHQEEQVITNEHQHQEEQVIADEQQNQKEQVEHHHQEESHHDDHHEDEFTNVRTEEQHSDTAIISEQKEETETKIINNETIEEKVTETTIITNKTTIGQDETFMSNEPTSPESSTIVKETIIGSDNDKLSTEHVDDSIITESNETLSTYQNVIEPTVNLSSGPAVTNENIEVSYEQTNEETTLNKDKEISIITTQEQSEDSVVESEVISSSTGEHTAKETVISSTMEAECSSFSTSIDATSTIDSENKVESESVNIRDLAPSETIETHKLGFEYDDMDEDDYNYDENGDDENVTTELTEDLAENLDEDILKEVILNNTWAKDDTYSYDESSLSQWTESYKPNPLVWPEDVHLEWSDIDKSEKAAATSSDGTTIISKEIEITNKSEIEVEGNSEHTFKETFTTSNDESNLKEVQSNEIPSTTLGEETITNQAESSNKSLERIVKDTPTQESYTEQKTKESEDKTGINTTVITSEFREKVEVEQYEKPESSATADEISVKASVFEQHKHLSEETVTSKTIEMSKATESLQENQSIPTGINVPRKIISISPNISSPGESTRNADLYTHNINVATNTLRPSKESVNTKSKHKKPVVEISTSREILKRDTRLKQQHGNEVNKIDMNLVYLVTSLATTFTLGIISMLYRSVFGTKK